MVELKVLDQFLSIFEEDDRSPFEFSFAVLLRRIFALHLFDKTLELNNKNM
jgi:hypothetical protein